MVIMTTLSILGVAAFVSLILCVLESKWYNSALSAVILGLIIFFSVRDTVGIDETVYNDCRVVYVTSVNGNVMTKVELPNGTVVYAGGMVPTATRVDVKMQEYPLTGLIQYVVVPPDVGDEVTINDPEPPVPSEDLYDLEASNTSVGQ